jgi:DNA-binding MarR family transcriptional regulator
MSVNVTASVRASGSAPNPLFLRADELELGIELLDAAYRALLAEPDRRLRSLGLTRNHQRLLHAVSREPGVTMARLQDAVQLTKQSLSRLLKELEMQGLIERRADPRDRRQRPIFLTARGRDLDEQLNLRLRRRIAEAYRSAGARAVAGYHEVLLGLLDERARRHLPARS